MFTNTSATVYNYHDGVYYKHTIPAVFWDSGKEVALGSGVEKIDKALILISQDEAYVEPKVWEALNTTNKALFYTIRPNGKDRIVKGSCAYVYGALHPITELLSGYENVLVISRAENRLYGSFEMRHIEVGGI
jgi:hypothetical protein